MKANPPNKAKAVIICGTDFTPAASQAADTAAAMAQRLNAPLELVHARISRAYPPMDDELSAEAARLRQQCSDVRVSMLDGEGDADEELVKRAKPRSCRLLVVSSVGRRALKRGLSGSVSERTAARARVPTLVVRDSAPFLEWMRGERALHVFVAFNFTETSEAALLWIKELLHVGPCVVVVGYVDKPSEQRARLGIPGPLDRDANLPEVQAILERDLQARVTELLGDTGFLTRVVASRACPDAALAGMAEEADVDLIVVGSHQYHDFERVWHRSVSRRLLHRAPMNVAVVPQVTLMSKPVTVSPAVERVLVATDFSVQANRAIPHAYSLLRSGGTVLLVHVIHPEQLPNGEYSHGQIDSRLENRHAKLVKERRHKLNARVPADAALSGILTEVEVVENPDVAQGISQAAERFGANAICLATHSHTRLESVIHDSVASSLLRRSSRPLYLVRASQG